MKKVARDALSPQDGGVLQINRTIIPIEEFATQNGISIDVVEKYKQLGILKVRKYKGQTFVINYNAETQNKMHDSTEKVAKLVDKICPKKIKNSDQSNQIDEDINLDEIIANPFDSNSAEMLEIIEELARQEKQAEPIGIPKTQKTESLAGLRSFLKNCIKRAKIRKTIITLSLICFLAVTFISIRFPNQYQYWVNKLKLSYTTMQIYLTGKIGD